MKQKPELDFIYFNPDKPINKFRFCNHCLSSKEIDEVFQEFECGLDFTHCPMNLPDMKLTPIMCPFIRSILSSVEQERLEKVETTFNGIEIYAQSVIF